MLICLSTSDFYNMSQSWLDRQFQNNILILLIFIGNKHDQHSKQVLTPTIKRLLHSYSPPLLTILVVQGLPPPFPSPSLTCRQEQSITVLGANWCLRSMWEQHTAVYPIGKNLFKTSCSKIWPYCNHSVLDPGQVPEIKGVTRSALRYNHQLLILCQWV